MSIKTKRAIQTLFVNVLNESGETRLRAFSEFNIGICKKDEGVFV
jgi:hypothetical protein